MRHHRRKHRPNIGLPKIYAYIYAYYKPLIERPFNQWLVICYESSHESKTTLSGMGVIRNFPVEEDAKMAISHSRFTRRHVMSGFLALPAAPVLAQNLPTNPDVIIIGAGAAGMSAARTLMTAGKTVVVLESAARTGGRAYTESSTFGLPYDHGSAWISAASQNPFKQIAEENGFTLLDHASADGALFVGDKRASNAEIQQYNSAWAAMEAGLDAGSYGGQDVAASTVVPHGMPLGGTAHAWMGPMDYGVDMDQLSTGDWYRGTGVGGSYLVAEGLGSVVATLAEGIPIRLNTPVTHIDWHGSGVRVQTSDGTISAKACIVTVSTGVLQAGKIGFSPCIFNERRFF
jgi:monoamine oxidase